MLPQAGTANRIAILGGGPAGATAAEKLLQPEASALCTAPPRVTVFEERRGWEKPCGGGLPWKALERYPYLLDVSEEHVLVRDAELVAAQGSAVRFQLRKPLAIYSRAVLNELLLQRAERAGARIVADRITGLHRAASEWRLQGLKGEYAADYIIVAAGARSLLRNLFAPAFAARDFMLTFGYYLPLADCDSLLRVQFFDEFEGYAWMFPRPDHLSLGICGKARMPELRERLHVFLVKFGYGTGHAATPAGATVYSHLLPALTPEAWGSLRLAGRDWALVGDAAGLVDPLTGEGIYYAMRSGELLARAWHAASSGPERAAAYAESIRRDFGQRLALGARLAPLFYHGDFFGGPPTTRLVNFAARSAAFRNLLQDLIEGSQSYCGLASRLYRGLGKSVLERAFAYAH